MSDSEIRIEPDPDQQRFVAYDGDTEAGFVAYRADGEVRVVTHTEVDDAVEGRGVGSALARAVLDDARQQGLSVRPDCRFVRSWIERHEDYQDLVSGTSSGD